MRTIVLAAAVLTFSGSVQAQEQHGDVFDQFFRYTEKENRAFFSEMPGETIDPFTGTLQLVKQDLVLPGKGGLDLRIVRSYSSKVWGRADLLDADPLLAEKEPSVLGYGWTFHFGRLKNPNATGQQTSVCSGDFPVYEEPDGSARVFYPVPGSNTVFVSKDFWRLEKNCEALDGLGACVWSSNGVRHELSPGGQFYVGTTSVWPVSRVVDRFGNRIAITYLPQTGAPDSVTDSYERTVWFDYVSDVDGLRLEKMRVNGREYLYAYETLTPSQTSGVGRLELPGPRRFLQEVQPPAGPPESYEYAHDATVAENQYALSKVVYTSGGSTTYRYEPVPFYTGRDTVSFSVVVGRTVHDRAGGVLGGWTYAYESPGPGPDFHKTTITRPDGRHDVYTIVGFGYVAGTSTGTVRSTFGVGLVLEIDRGDGTEMEGFQWDGTQLPPVSEAVFSAPAYSDNCGPYYVWDDGVYVPMLTQRQLWRDGALYTTRYSSFDEFGQARGVVEEGLQGAIGDDPPPAQVRTTSWAFFSRRLDEGGATLNLVRDMPTSQLACEGSDCVLSEWTYGGQGYSKDSETRSGVATSFQHDNTGNLTGVTNALNQTLTLSDYAYGVPRDIDFNQAFSVTRTVSWEGRILTQKDGRGHTTTQEYDGIGRPERVTPPGNSALSIFAYAPDGSSVTLTRGSYTKTTLLDGLGREVSTSDSEDVLTSTRYDAMGRAWFRSYPYDATRGEVGARFEFDGLGRAVTQTNAYRPAPVDTCETPGACKVATEYLANCVKTVTERGPDDSVTAFACSTSFGDPAERRLTQVYDAAGGLWEYAYTTAGNLSSVTAPLPQGNRSFVYDAREFLLRETSGESGTLTFESNAMGQVTSKADERPITVGFGYVDPLSRLRTVDYPGAADDVSRAYDDANNLTHLSSENGGAFVYQYDELNRPLSQTWMYLGRSYVTTYHHDADGCLDRIVYPTGTVVTAICDTAARPTSIHADGATVVRDTTYHPSGQTGGFTFGNGLRTEVSFDDRGRTTAVSSPALDLRYGYDGADNVKSLENLAVANSSRTMTYDPLDRLLSVSHPVWGVASYQYDPLGNRTWSPIRDISMRFEYDERNRLAWASQELKPSSSAFGWDAANRLTASSDGASYRYDGLDRRIAKTEAGQTTVYHHDASGRVIAETTPQGLRLRDYVYLGDKLVAVQGCMEGASSSGCTLRQWYHTDTLGSVLARTDASGTVVTRFDYRAWGERATADGVEGDRQYNGRVYDEGTGFHDYGARMYWPEIGRFVSADTIPVVPGSLDSMNRYSYVANNPYRYVDPTGRKIALRGSSLNTAQYAAAVAYLSADKGMAAIVRRLEASRTTYVIRFDLQAESSFDPITRTLTWNPGMALATVDDGSPTGGFLSPAMNLGHELGHADNWDQSPAGYTARKLIGSKQWKYDDLEERKVIKEVEQPAAEKLGEGRRDNHRGGPMSVPEVAPPTKGEVCR